MSPTGFSESIVRGEVEGEGELAVSVADSMVPRSEVSDKHVWHSFQHFVVSYLQCVTVNQIQDKTTHLHLESRV